MSVKRPDIEPLIGSVVEVKYRTKKKADKARIGTLKSIGLRNVHLETIRGSGREYMIPIRSVKTISEVSA